MVTAKLWVFDLGLSVAVGGVGIGAAWWMRRFTLLSARNLYPGAAVGVLGIAVSALLGWRVGQLVLLPIAAPWVAAASVGHRWRQSDLGAGEELGAHELSRRWLWEPRRRLPQGERRFLGSQGELVHERQWPDSLAYVSMTAERAGGARLPLGAGQHVVMFGATGAGKTTTARRLVAARTLAQHSALLVLDQKGDASDMREMRALAAAAGVPFILFDSQDPDTDRWQPLWGTPTGLLPAPWNPSGSQSPTTTTSYDGIWTSYAGSCTPPTAGHRRSRCSSTRANRCATQRYMRSPRVLATSRGL